MTESVRKVIWGELSSMEVGRAHSNLRQERDSRSPRGRESLQWDDELWQAYGAGGAALARVMSLAGSNTEFEYKFEF